MDANDAFRANVTANVGNIVGLKKRVDEHQETVNAILEKFNEYLMAEISKRGEVEKRVNQFQFVLREVKGRVGALEPKFKGIQTDMDDVEAKVDDIRKDSSFLSATSKNKGGPSDFFQDQIEKLGRIVGTAMKKLKELEGDVDTHRMIINELNSKTTSDGSRFNQGWAVAQNPEANGWVTSLGSGGKAVAGKSEDFNVAEFHFKMVSAASILTRYSIPLLTALLVW